MTSRRLFLLLAALLTFGVTSALIACSSDSTLAPAGWVPFSDGTRGDPKIETTHPLPPPSK